MGTMICSICGRCSGINCQEPEQQEYIKEGTEEGETCNRDGCVGVIAIKPSEHCSCHISPPCNQCVTAPLYCPECGWEYEDEDQGNWVHDPDMGDQ